MIFVGLALSLIPASLCGLWLAAFFQSSIFGLTPILIGLLLLLLGFLGILWQIVSILTSLIRSRSKNEPFPILSVINLVCYFLIIISFFGIPYFDSSTAFMLFLPAPILWFTYFITLIVRYRASGRAVHK